MLTLAFDIGGTKISVVPVNTITREIIETPLTIPTPNFLIHPSLSTEELQSLLVNTITDIVKAYQLRYQEIHTVGIAFAGAVTDKGVAHTACSLWHGLDYPLQAKLSEELPGTKFVVVNDVAAAAQLYAEEDDTEDGYSILYIAGTGVGSKVIDRKQKSVILDRRGFAGENGHVRVNFSADAMPCDCGGTGCLNAEASGRAVERKLAIKSQAWAEKYPILYPRSFLGRASIAGKLTNDIFIAAVKARDPFAIFLLR